MTEREPERWKLWATRELEGQMQEKDNEEGKKSLTKSGPEQGCGTKTDGGCSFTPRRSTTAYTRPVFAGTHCAGRSRPDHD